MASRTIALVSVLLGACASTPAPAPNAPSASARAPSSADAPEVPSSLHVLVVDGATKQPVAGAVVEYVRNADWEPETFAGLFTRRVDLEANRQELVTRARTDANGAVDLVDAIVERGAPVLRRILLRIDASSPGTWGVLDPATSNGRAARIELAPDVSRRFLVRTAGLAVPAGVRVGLESTVARDAASPNRERTGAEEGEDDASAGPWFAETDPHGLAVLPHVSYYRGFLPEGVATSVIANYDDDQGVSVCRPFELVAGDDVVLDLPDASHLELACVDGRGRPLQAGLLEFVFADSIATADWGRAGERSIRDGRADLPALAPGRKLVLRASAPHRCPEVVEVETAARPGETKRVDVALARDPVTLTGRLLDEGHRGWRDASLEVLAAGTADAIEAVWEPEVSWTDAEGRFRLEVDPELVTEAKGELLLHVAFERASDDPSGHGIRSSFRLAATGTSPPQSASVTVPLPIEGHVVELGDVVVTRAR